MRGVDVRGVTIYIYNMVCGSVISYDMEMNRENMPKLFLFTRDYQFIDYDNAQLLNIWGVGEQTKNLSTSGFVNCSGSKWVWSTLDSMGSHVFYFNGNGSGISHFLTHGCGTQNTGVPMGWAWNIILPSIKYTKKPIVLVLDKLQVQVTVQ